MIQLGLVGYPLEHSFSPKIHKASLDVCGQEGNYSLFPIRSDDQQGLKEMLNRIRSGEITGLNVTIPHKQKVIPQLDDLTSLAKGIGAVNTIFMENGRLIGDNTDAPGFLADLRRFIRNRERGSGNRKFALVLGAGGSARAVVYALVNDGWTVTIAARRPEQAQELISHYPNSNSRITGIEYRSPVLNAHLSTFYLIINTTPVGMSPNVNASPWPANSPFPPNAAIYDLIYYPYETKLVKDARAAGLSATTGQGMLIEQAAFSFEIWTGCSVSREPLFAAMEEL